MDNLYLAHHGVLGMKWGVRRYQNKDGSLTAAGEQRYGKKIQKMEQKAINKTYKDERKNGGHFVVKSGRRSTGKNFDEAEKNFEKRVLSDKKYKELSKKAEDIEYKRLMAEKPYMEKAFDDDFESYNEYVNSEEAEKLYVESAEATRKKNEYVQKMAKDYIDTIKEAKIKDLNITEHKEIAKKYISDRFDNVVWDGKLEYDVDNYYDPDWLYLYELDKQKRGKQ